MISAQFTRSGYGAALLLAAAAAIGAWWILVVLADLRLVLAIVGALALVQLCIRKPQTALAAMLVWLPFAGLVRRLFDYSFPVDVDPLLAIGPIVTGTVALVAAWNYRGSVGESVHHSTSTRLVAIMLGVLAISVFNPIQGGVLTGLAGTTFFFFPVLWFFLGRAYFDELFMDRLFGLVTIVGVVSALYGAYQAAFGLLPFDVHWIVSRGFSSMWVDGFIRPFSTFPNPEEWSRYMTIAATIALGSLATGSSRRVWWAIACLVCTGSLFLAGVRTSIFGYVISLAVVCVLARTSRPMIVARLGGLVGVLVAYLVLVPVPTRQESFGSEAAWRAFFGHTVRGLSTPLGEDSLWARTDLWSKLFTDVIPRYPLGMGIGVPIQGAWRFDAAASIGTESYAIAMFVAAGVIGGGLILAIFVVVSLRAWRLCVDRGDRVSLITCAVLANLIFTSLVGNSLSLYTIGPMGWALIGWVSAQRMGRSQGGAPKRLSRGSRL